MIRWRHGRECQILDQVPRSDSSSADPETEPQLNAAEMTMVKHQDMTRSVHIAIRPTTATKTAKSDPCNTRSALGGAPLFPPLLLPEPPPWTKPVDADPAPDEAELAPPEPEPEPGRCPLEPVPAPVKPGTVATLLVWAEPEADADADA